MACRAETIKGQTGASYGCSSKSVSVYLDFGLGCMPDVSVTPYVSVTQSTTASAVCRLWCYITEDDSVVGMGTMVVAIGRDGNKMVGMGTRYFTVSSSTI